MLFTLVVREAANLGLYLVMLRRLGDRGHGRAAAAAVACLAVAVAFSAVFGRDGAVALSIYERNAVNILFSVALYAVLAMVAKGLGALASFVWSMVFVSVQQSTHKLFAYVLGPALNALAPGLSQGASEALHFCFVAVCGLAFVLALAPTEREAHRRGAVAGFQVGLLAFVLADCTFLVLTGNDGPFLTWRACMNALQCLVPAVCACVVKRTVSYNCELIERGRVAALSKAQYERLMQKRRADDDVRRMYHDLRHILAAFHSEEETERIVGSLRERRAGAEATHYAPNVVLDMLLNEASQRCRAHGVRFEAEVNMGPCPFIDDEDLCLLFGNAFSNALEAAERVPDGPRRFVSFSAVERKAAVVFRVENGYEGELRRDGRAFLTTKDDRDAHGIGMRSIAAVAECYGGLCDAVAADGLFCLTVTLPIPR